MRVVKSFQDCNIVFKELLDFKRRIETQSLDLKGHQIKNMGDGTDPTDAVTLKQLPALAGSPVDNIPVYTQVWESSGPVNTGDKINAFVAGLGKDGTPNQAFLIARTAAANASLKVNFTIDGTTLMDTPVELPIGQVDVPVFSSAFVSVVAKIKIGSAVIPIIVQGDGIVDVVTIGLIVTRNR